MTVVCPDIIEPAIAIVSSFYYVFAKQQPQTIGHITQTAYRSVNRSHASQVGVD